jgi:hypothetical protein
MIRDRTFDNAVGELVLDGRAAHVTLRRSPREGEDPERLVALHRTELVAAAGPGIADPLTRAERTHGART